MKLNNSPGLNIGAHKEAAEHFLSALSLQETSGTSETSDTLWSTLRKALYDMVWLFALSLDVKHFNSFV